jgi:hypothetical protein
MTPAAVRKGRWLKRETNQFVALVLLSSLHLTWAQPARSVEQSASRLLQILLSQDRTDDEWTVAERQFAALPPEDAIRALLPEIAKGMPAGGIYNCYDPFHDRTHGDWGKFCVVNWLWCKQLACPQKRGEALKVLLELWPQPTSFHGQIALLQGLCHEREAEGDMAALFRDGDADSRLRTEAGVCLLYQDAAKYHRDVVAFAEQSPPNLRQRLFNELAFPSPIAASELDPAVIRMGFALLLEEADKQANVRRQGQMISDYAQFIYADHLGRYLHLPFAPDQKSAIYTGSQGIERWYHDSVINALNWWSKHKNDYMN